MRFVFLLFIFSSSIVTAQKFEFVGFIKSPDIGIVPYKISFNVLKNDSLYGTSTYDFNGVNRTRSKISGVFDQKRKIITFKELENVTTKATVSSDNFCYIQSDKIKLSKSKDNLILSGTFTSSYPNDSVCITGGIYLISASILDVISENINKYDGDSLKIDADVAKNIISDLRKEETLLTGGESLTLSIKSDSVIVEVWDNYKEDNDRISILYRNEVVLSDVAIQNRKKRIVLDTKNSGGELFIKALNEGKLPLNTIDFLIIENESTTAVSTRLKTGEVVRIILNRSN
jgi:hypothetical protein